MKPRRDDVQNEWRLLVDGSVSDFFLCAFFYSKSFTKIPHYVINIFIVINIDDKLFFPRSTT